MTGRSKRSQQKGPPVNPELAALRAEVTAGLPTGSNRPSAEGVKVTKGGKGNHGRFVGDKFVSNEEIVERTRALLADNWPPGDIKRVLARTYGGKGVSFKRHLSLARKRNLAMLGRTKPEAKADSLQQWRVMQAEQRQKRAKCEQEVEQAKQKLARLQAVFDEADDAALEVATLRLEQQTAVLVRAERRLSDIMTAIERHQHTIDNLLGNRAPFEIQDTSEKKAELANPTEPLTAKESDAKLRELLGKIRGEITAEVSTPSTN